MFDFSKIHEAEKLKERKEELFTILGSRILRTKDERAVNRMGQKAVIAVSPVHDPDIVILMNRQTVWMS